MIKFIEWNIEENIPLINRGKPLIKIGKHDIWFGSEYEKKIISRLIKRDLDISLDTSSKSMIFRRLPSEYGEYAAEVWCDGAKYGVLLYSTREGWVFYPTGALASILAHHMSQVCRIPSIKRRLKGKYIQITNSCYSRTKYLIFITGKYVGICKRKGGKCKVKDLAPHVFKELPSVRPDKIVNANKHHIDTIINEAIGFIKKTASKYNPPYAIAFSGGIDSTITLYLVAKALGTDKIIAVYSDTGLEFPETKLFVERITEKLGVHLEVVESGKKFLELVNEERELPSRDNRWCTGLLKIRPLYEFYKKNNIRLVFEGIRMYESSSRGRLPRITTSRYMPGIRRALPIISWTRLEAQLVALHFGLEINPLYDRGFTRIGCIICPAMNMHELHISYTMNEKVFKEIADNLDTDIGYILSGKWRKRPINMANPPK